MAQHEIKTIVAELQSMSPRTQLEIVRLCKKVAELTPDYIDTLAAEAAEELRPTILALGDRIDNEITDRKAIVENVNGENKLKTTGTSQLAGVYVSDAHTDVANENSVEIDGGLYMIELNTSKAEMHSMSNDESVKIENHEVTITNNNHVLKLDASGNLTIDGNAIGGGDAYVHRILLLIDGSNASIEIITDSSTPFNATSLYQYLYDANCRTVANPFWINQIRTSDGTTIKFLNGIYASSNNIKASLFKFSGSVSEQLNASFNGDNVFPVKQ